MKFIVVPILLFLVATQAFSKWVLLLEFRWNRDYIAKNLCENRARPMLKCGGKCQLMKRMVQEEKENAPSQNQPGKSGFQEVLFTATPLPVYTPSMIVEKPSRFAPGQHWKTFSPSCEVFRPPLV